MVLFRPFPLFRDIEVRFTDLVYLHMDLNTRVRASIPLRSNDM